MEGVCFNLADYVDIVVGETVFPGMVREPAGFRVPARLRPLDSSSSGPSMHRYRSHTCGMLREQHIGETVRISGWVHRVRDHGGVLFIDLRDHYGLTQVVADPEASDALEAAHAVGIVHRDRYGPVQATVLAALAGATDVLWITDRRGRDIGVPTAKIAYVELGSAEGGEQVVQGGVRPAAMTFGEGRRALDVGVVQHLLGHARRAAEGRVCIIDGCITHVVTLMTTLPVLCPIST